MVWLQNFLTPITVAFLVIVIGYFFGKIKVFGISLDLAAVLMVAVIGGFLITVFPLSNITLYLSNMKLYMKMFSSLGTALFVSVIGLNTGYSLNSGNRKDLIAVLTGVVMVITAIFTLKIVDVFDSIISESSLLGVLCGALTTTPGLSVVCESVNIISEEAVLGYGSAYIFGVLSTVVFVQIIMRHSKMINSVSENKGSKGQKKFGVFMQICITVILGNLIGTVKFPIINFCLGGSGGMLFGGILLGYIIQNYLPSYKANTDIFGLFRNFGLVLFFVGYGIPAGMELKSSFNPKFLLYGAIMTIVPIAVGFLISKILNLKTELIIAGGMTSTPAIGVVLQKDKNISLAEYSFAYVGALLTIMISMRMLV